VSTAGSTSTVLIIIDFLYGIDNYGHDYSPLHSAETSFALLIIILVSPYGDTWMAIIYIYTAVQEPVASLQKIFPSGSHLIHLIALDKLTPSNP
jgi:hypothetical protein